MKDNADIYHLFIQLLGEDFIQGGEVNITTGDGFKDFFYVFPNPSEFYWCVVVSIGRLRGEFYLNLQTCVHCIKECPIPAGSFGEDMDFADGLSLNTAKNFFNGGELRNSFRLGPNLKDARKWVSEFWEEVSKSLKEQLARHSNILAGDPLISLCRPLIASDVALPEIKGLEKQLIYAEKRSKRGYSASKFLGQLIAQKEGGSRWYT